MLLLWVAGCQWLSVADLDRKLDADNDGIELDVDCDDDDATIGLAPTWYPDADGDGFGDLTAGQVACDAPANFVDNGDDCDDTLDLVHPDGLEICNGRDDDCDLEVDDLDPSLDRNTAAEWGEDADGDGFPAENGPTVRFCDQPPGFVSADVAPDCDDTAEAINPSALEVCGDQRDNDCNGLVDEFGFNNGSWYLDEDGDDWPSDFVLREQCDDDNGLLVLAAGFDPATDPVDCAPLDPSIHPGAVEIYYDDVDQNCDGADDFDRDGDGYVLDAFAGSSPLPAGDCNDDDAARSPDMPELCNGIDDDCDGLADDPPVQGGTAFLVDADLDGFPSDDLIEACVEGPGVVSTVNPPEIDCDDTALGVYPGAPEIPGDQIDQDCSGFDSALCFGDTDQDGVGGTLIVLVDGPDCGPDASEVGGDCNDTDPTVNPNAIDWCDAIDQDCDGLDPVGAATILYDDGTRAALVGNGLSLEGVESVSFCGGDFDVRFEPEDGVDALIRGEPGYVSVLTPSGSAFVADGARPEWNVTFEGLVVSPSSEVVFDVDGNPNTSFLSLRSVAVQPSTPEGVLRASGVTLDLDEVDFEQVEATGVAPITLEGGAVLTGRALRFADGSGAVTGGVFADGAQVVLDDSSFEGLVGTEGGALHVENGDLELRRSAVSNGLAVDGGALFARDSTVLLNGSSLSDSTALGEGGALWVERSSVSIQEGAMRGNQATAGGAVVQLDGSLLADSLTIADNVADDGGGVAVGGIGLLVLEGGRVEQNQATEFGGGVVCTDQTTCVLQSVVFEENLANLGGGVSSQGTASVRLVDVSGSRNTAVTGGGVVHHNSSAGMTVIASTFTANAALQGGAFRANHTLEIEDSVFTGNTAAFGGAIFTPVQDTAQLKVDACTFDANVAATHGGAIHATDVEVLGSTFTFNEAADGGALFAEERCYFSGFPVEPGLVVVDSASTFDDNIAAGNGGAISIGSATAVPNPCPPFDFLEPSTARIAGFYARNSAENGGAVAGSVRISPPTRMELNTAVNGGALYGSISPTEVFTLCLQGVGFRDNVATGVGGALYLLNNGDSTCLADVYGNQAASAGAVYLERGDLDKIRIHPDNTSADGIDVLLGTQATYDENLTSPYLPQVIGHDNGQCVFTTPGLMSCNGTACAPCP